MSAIEATTPKIAAYDIPIHGAFGSFLLFEYLNIFTMKKIDVRVYVVKNAFANRANPLDKSASDELPIIAKNETRQNEDKTCNEHDSLFRRLIHFLHLRDFFE